MEQDSHPPPPIWLKSRLESRTNPMPLKSILMGLACAIKSLPTTKVCPFISTVSSLSDGSSRAIASDGPPQPPALRKIRMGEGDEPVKKASICSFATSDNSIMLYHLLILILVKFQSNAAFIPIGCLLYRNRNYTVTIKDKPIMGKGHYHIKQQ